jgi:hypothetical protein
LFENQAGLNIGRYLSTVAGSGQIKDETDKFWRQYFNAAAI